MLERIIQKTHEQAADLERSHEFYKTLGWVALEEIHGQDLAHNPGDIPIPPTPGTVQLGGNGVNNPLDYSRPAGPKAESALSNMAKSAAFIRTLKSTPSTAVAVAPPAPSPGRNPSYRASRPESATIGGRLFELTPKTASERRAELKLAKRVRKLKDLQSDQLRRSKIYGDTTDHSPLLAGWEQIKGMMSDRKAYSEGLISAAEYQERKYGRRGMTVPHPEKIKKVRVRTPAGFAFIGATISKHLGTREEQVTADAIEALTRKTYEGAVQPGAYNRRARKIERLHKRAKHLETADIYAEKAKDASVKGALKTVEASQAVDRAGAELAVKGAKAAIRGAKNYQKRPAGVSKADIARLRQWRAGRKARKTSPTP